MIDKDSYMAFAQKVYDNPGCADDKEFEYDARRPLRIKFILRKWLSENREINARHLMNHIIVMHNCFGKFAVHMISVYCEEHISLILPFFDYLGYTPTYLNFGGKIIVVDMIERDPRIIEILRKHL